MIDERAQTKAMLKALRETLKSLPRGKAGRPKGSSNFTPVSLANSQATADVLIAKDEYRARTGAKHVPDAETEKFLKVACKNNPLAKKSTVRNKVLRGKIKRLRSKALSQL